MRLDWYERKLEIARKVLKGDRKAKYGSDVDLGGFARAPAGAKFESLAELGELERASMGKAGLREDGGRLGTFIVYDGSLAYSEFMGERGLAAYESGGLVLASIDEALSRYPDVLSKYWFGVVPVGLDKYSAYVALNRTGGLFAWAREGAKVDRPVQACFFMGGLDKAVQAPHNVIVAEDGSRLHIVTGCAAHPAAKRIAHIAVTDIYVGRGAEVTWTMIHLWPTEALVRPRVGAVVEEGGQLIMSYVLASPARSLQAYPTVILRGEGARATISNVVACSDGAELDLGSAIYLLAPNSRGDILSRAVARGGARASLRGKLVGRGDGSRGHLECRALVMGDAEVRAYPSLISEHPNAELTHEAAIGKVAEEQICYLMSRGLDEREAAAVLARGFMKSAVSEELPPELAEELRKAISAAAEAL